MLVRYLSRAAGLAALLIGTSAWAHSHGHSLTEAEQKAADGVFADADVKDRTLKDWEGMWQSVYPLLLSGELDPVFKQKAEKSPGKSAGEIKEYYRKGYVTDVQRIDIEDGVMTFHSGKTEASCHYAYAGYKILTYASGKKGVRYLFDCQDASSKAPKFVQFSDHIIGPRQSQHFHIFTGNTSQAQLLSEMVNWPTYYPEQLHNAQVVEEMLHH